MTNKDLAQYVEWLLEKSLATRGMTGQDAHTLAGFCKDDRFFPKMFERLSEQDDEVFFFAAPTCLRWLEGVAANEKTASLLVMICERVNQKNPLCNTEHDQLSRGKEALREYLFFLQQEKDIQTMQEVLLHPAVSLVYQDEDGFGYSYESIAEQAIQHRFVDLFKVAYTNLKKRTSEYPFHPYNDQHLWNTAFACNNLEVMDILAEEPMSTEKAHQLLKKHLYHLYQYRAGEIPFEDTPYIRRLTNHLHVPFVFFKESNNPELLDYYYRAMEPDKQQEMVEEFF